MHKASKIIATVGPATRSEQHIIGLYHGGANIIRLNFSHKNYEEKAKVVKIIHTLNQQGITQLSILMDSKGPEIRTGHKLNKSHYHAGEQIKLTVQEAECNEHDIFCDYQPLLEDLKVGDIIRIDSGLFDVRVEEIAKDYCMVKALNDASIGSCRHINLPGKKLRLPSLSMHDQEDLRWAIQHDIHIVAMSFVRRASDITVLRSFWQEHGGGQLCVCAKLENMEAIENLDEIIQASDVIMVARGDLGVELDITMIPVYQNKIVQRCHYYGKAVIIATQMIESMMSAPVPTRAEIQDIYQAIQMGVDAVMLSGETAVGLYPLQALQYMKDTIDTAEQHRSRGLNFAGDEGRDLAGIRYKLLK